MKLHINMFGKFSIYLDGKAVFEYTGRTKKLWNLLEFMLINRDCDISQDNLVQVAQLDEKSDKPENALKNLMYRLRNLLSDSGLPEEDYIVCERGVYSWNKDIICTLDIELFEEEWKTACNPTLPEEERLAHYLDAIKMYKGHFLPKSELEEWVIPMNAYYRRIYCDCINSAYKIYSHQGNYEPLIDICHFAISLDPYNENLNELYILALVKLNRHKEALKFYNDFIEKLYKELGVNPSENMSNLYQEIIKTLNNVQMDINLVKDDLREANALGGAYFCQYEIFKNMYRLLARSIPRTGQSVYLALFTVSDNNGDLPSVKMLNSSMRMLFESIGCSLRKGDVFARYSNTQYVLMLPSLTFEDSKIVIKRILSNFHGAYRNKKIVVNYMLQPLDPVKE